MSLLVVYLLYFVLIYKVCFIFFSSFISLSVPLLLEGKGASSPSPCAHTNTIQWSTLISISAVYIILCIVYIILCTVYIILYTVYIILCTVYIKLCVFYVSFLHKIMPIRMLFTYRFLLHFINNYPSDTIKNSVIHHNHETRLKASNAITSAKFKTNKGQRSMLFSAAKLFNTYLHDFGSVDSGSLKLRLAGRLWEKYGAAGASRWD